MPFFKKVFLPAVILLALLATGTCVSAVALGERHKGGASSGAKFDNNRLYAVSVAALEKINTFFGSGANRIRDLQSPVPTSQVAGNKPVYMTATAGAASYVIEHCLISYVDDGSVDLLGRSLATLENDCPGQAYALRISCAAVNGTILEPGAVFPLSERLGRYLTANDLVNAFHDENFSEDKRSGICRLVNTLYSASRQANLGIVESTPCLWPSNYLLPGYDPILGNNLPDIELINHDTSPKYIFAVPYDGHLEVRIYGGRRDFLQDQPASVPVNTVYPPEKLDLGQIRSSSRYQGLIFSVPRAGKEIALTFDDGPDPNLTPGYLKVLQDEGVHATFFLIGRRIEQAPGMAAMIAGAGEEIGNHTMNHEYLTKIPVKDGERNLIDTTSLIEREAHQDILCFRPPGGKLSPGLIKMARQAGMKTVLWNIDPRDWTPGIAPDQIVRGVLSNLQPGAIVVMHEGKRQTLEALPALIRELKQRGWRLVTISELLSDGLNAHPVTQPPAAKRT